MNKPIMKTITAITVNRSDFGRMLPVYQRLTESRAIDFELIVTAAHFSDDYGFSVNEVRNSGLKLKEIKVDYHDLLLADAQILTQVGLYLRSRRPDALLLLGDRHELLSCAQAAMLSDIPIFHVGGGYITEGAIDDRVRHAVSKLSHVHLVANQCCADRLAQMGEDTEQIFVVGAPDLDMVRLTERLSPETLMLGLGLKNDKPFLLVTIHPETHLHRNLMETYTRNVFKALKSRKEQILITAPSADYGSDLIFAEIDALVKSRNDAVFIHSLGAKRYVSAMAAASAVVGNSSSGIIESGFFPIPVVNIGDRQKGRVQGANVIDCSWATKEVNTAIDLAMTPEFHEKIQYTVSPYGDGYSASKIADISIQHAGNTTLTKPFISGPK